MDAALQTYLGRTRGRRLERSVRHFVEFEIVSRAAQIFGPAAFRERAETAVVQTDVRVVDIAIDDVGDRIAHRLATQAVRRGNYVIEVATLDAEEAHDMSFTQRMPCASRLDDRFDSRSAIAAL